MKKILLILLVVTFSSSAFADPKMELGLDVIITKHSVVFVIPYKPLVQQVILDPTLINSDRQYLKLYLQLQMVLV